MSWRYQRKDAPAPPPPLGAKEARALDALEAAHAACQRLDAELKAHRRARRLAAYSLRECGWPYARIARAIGDEHGYVIGRIFRVQ